MQICYYAKHVTHAIPINYFSYYQHSVKYFQLIFFNIFIKFICVEFTFLVVILMDVIRVTTILTLT